MDHEYNYVWLICGFVNGGRDLTDWAMVNQV